jgi:hypothetical protein
MEAYHKASKSCTNPAGHQGEAAPADRLSDSSGRSEATVHEASRGVGPSGGGDTVMKRI